MIGTTATLKITGAALLIFAAGVVTGSFTTSVFQTRKRERPARVQPALPPSPETSANPLRPASVANSGTNRRPEKLTGRPPGWQRFEALRRLEDQIQLSVEQRDRIRSMIRESEQRIRSDWEPVVPRIQTEVRELRKRIAAELNPEQRERFEALFERRETAQPGKASRRTNAAPEALR